MAVTDDSEARRAIKFALSVDDHYDRLEFLEAWFDGDTSEWPEFGEPPSTQAEEQSNTPVEVVVPAEGTEERDFWLEAAEQHGFLEPATDSASWLASEDSLLKLIASCREQGRRDVLGLPPKEPE
jgi:hypothetical protein